MFSSSSKFQEQTESKMWKRWQLFHATDFQSLMSPGFIFCRIIGIFPYKINASTIETSRLRNILLAFFLCVFCIFELNTFHKILITKTVSYGDITKNLEAISYFIFGGFIAIITYVLSGPRMRVLQAMLEISSKLPSETYQKLSRWIHVKDILGSFFVIIQESVYYFRETEHFMCFVLSTYIALLVFNMDMQYLNCVCVLKACFKRINDNLAHLQNDMNDKSYVSRLICDTQENQLLLIKLKTLKKQHLIFSDRMQMLNVIFSLQLLATTALTFTETTFEIYSHVIRWQNGVSIMLDNKFRDMFFLTSIAFCLLKLILIVWACQTSKNQAFEMATTIHDVLNCTSDEQIKEELHIFSLQILHCAQSTFSTKGLTVDATLLAAMAGSITTYILILAQFMVMSHSCDNKTANNITQITI
ncbi:PREDICTED: uncharacterized protein LOC105568947 [Vollenhovia emeryi]|uniref:uncharacterized protein LOC105568947 n=1 Tax=Vollenhovia emeryi TaxID=411798 RepID=UPI0005F40458|nr:PREDICTED: uncharacterized protein LOC105568947 [Vollenhovia emeryi]